jgi:hypothetical protein
MIRYSGITRAMGGTMYVDRNSSSEARWPRKRNRANA